MDLSKWDFNKDGTVALNGEWECYDGQLLEPEDFNGSTNQKPILTGYSNLTATRKLTSDVGLTEAKGMRTYRLVVTTNPSQQLLALKLDNIRMSNKIFISGKLLGQSGNPAEENKGYKPKNEPYIAYFASNGSQLEILLQVANYDYPFKGYMYTIILGSQRAIGLQNTFISSLELCGAILSLFFCLFYFFLYIMGKRERLMLAAILQFLAITIMFLFTGSKLIYDIFPNLPFELLCKVQMLSLTLVAVSIITYTNQISKRVITDTCVKVLLAVYSIYSLLVLIAPFSIYAYVNPLIYSSFVAVFIYILLQMYLIFKESSHNLIIRRHISIFFICLASLMISLLENFLFALNLVSSKTISSICFSIFVLFSQLFLVYRFVLNYNAMIKAGKVKDEFITKTSYALKAPLGSIINTSESLLMQDKSKEDLYQEGIFKAAVIKNTAQHLLEIVNSTLDVTLLKNDQLKLAITGVDMKVCAELVIEGCEDLIKNKDIVLHTELPEILMAEADESRVRQILWNLINNSIQNMEKGRITIYGKQNGTMITMWVEDTGCGIPEAKSEYIFKPYSALRSNGIGLGLYLTRQLLELMGGEIHLKWSKINIGSCFEFSLPAYKGKGNLLNVDHNTGTQLLKYTFHDTSNYSGKEKPENTVLVVDDEIFNIQTASYVLNKEGYGVLTAFSGEEAIKKIKENSVDLVILDVLMPGKSGISICKKIREKYSLIELPVLIATVGNSNDDLVLALKAGANDFIAKPFEEKEMVSRVRTLISLKSSMEEAVKSELAFLQAQIRPHFLYNAINTIISLCYTDSEKAAELLADFSKYLRLTFDIDNKLMMIPLNRELELVKAYVEIEKARFGEIINVEYNVAPELADIEIPPLCIQPLVENAIKHGLWKKQGGGTVYVTVKKDNGTLVIKVRDTGIGMPAEKVELLKNMESRNEGVGFFNVSKRVRRWKNARLDINSTEGEGTTVTITVGQAI